MAIANKTNKTTTPTTSDPNSPKRPSTNGSQVKTPVVNSPELPSAAKSPANTETTGNPTPQLKKPTPQQTSAKARLPANASASPKRSPQTAPAEGAPVPGSVSDSQAAQRDESATPTTGAAVASGAQQKDVPRAAVDNASSSSARKLADATGTERPEDDDNAGATTLAMMSHLTLNERCEFLSMVGRSPVNETYVYLPLRIRTDLDDNRESLEKKFGREPTDRFLADFGFLWDVESRKDSDELGDRDCLVRLHPDSGRVNCLVTTRAVVMKEIEKPLSWGMRVLRESICSGKNTFAVTCFTMQDVAFWLNHGVPAFHASWLPTSPEELNTFLRPYLFEKTTDNDAAGESRKNSPRIFAVQSGILELGERACEAFKHQHSVLRQTGQAYPDLADRIQIVSYHPAWSKEFYETDQGRRPELSRWNFEPLPGAFSVHSVADYCSVTVSPQPQPTASPATDRSHQPPEAKSTASQSGLNRDKQAPKAYEEALRKVHERHEQLGNFRAHLGLDDYFESIAAEKTERSLFNKFRQKHSDGLRAVAEMTSDTELAMLYRSAAYYCDLCNVALVDSERVLAVWSKRIVSGETDRIPELLGRLRDKHTSSRGKSGENDLATFMKICRRIREVESGGPSRSSPRQAAQSYLPRW